MGKSDCFGFLRKVLTMPKPGKWVIFVSKIETFFFWKSLSVFLRLYLIAGINKLMKMHVLLKMVQVGYYCALNNH